MGGTGQKDTRATAGTPPGWGHSVQRRRLGLAWGADKPARDHRGGVAAGRGSGRSGAMNGHPLGGGHATGSTPGPDRPITSETRPLDP